jgi:hypothetical protein
MKVATIRIHLQTSYRLISIPLIAAHVPYKVVGRQIANVFDLRRPECQTFIVEEFFKRDTKQLKKENRSGINMFIETLPMLMHPHQGGGRATDDNGIVAQRSHRWLLATVSLPSFSPRL